MDYHQHQEHRHLEDEIVNEFRGIGRHLGRAIQQARAGRRVRPIRTARPPQGGQPVAEREDALSPNGISRWAAADDTAAVLNDNLADLRSQRDDAAQETNSARRDALNAEISRVDEMKYHADAHRDAWDQRVTSAGGDPEQLRAARAADAGENSTLDTSAMVGEQLTIISDAVAAGTGVDVAELLEATHGDSAHTAEHGSFSDHTPQLAPELAQTISHAQEAGL